MNKKKIIINLTEDWFFVSHFLEERLSDKFWLRSIYFVMKQLKEKL